MTAALTALAIISAIFLVTCTGYMAGQMDCRKEIQDELVQSGHAEYYLDEDGDKQWRMKK
jgi:PBP1b-binding outer membrane lipoprotein LpoB